MKMLDVKNLQVSFHTYAGEVKAVNDVSFSIDEGEAIAIVGESGSGKTVTCQTVLGLIPCPPGEVKGGQVIFAGEDLLQKSEREMQHIRGNQIGMIFQDPMTSLNPVLTIGRQLTEALCKHKKMSKPEAHKKAVELLTMVGIPNPEQRLRQYPHEFSGGMRQRVMIAMAISCQPRLLIADEPTTALDVTIQAQILELMLDLKERLHSSIIIITHDLGVVARIARRIVVMYAGKIVESGLTDDIYYNPQHPYTEGLLNSVPRLDDTQKTRLTPIFGNPPDLLLPLKGCPFYPRCRYRMRVCSESPPENYQISAGHASTCWLHHPQVSANLKLKGGLASNG